MAGCGERSEGMGSGEAIKTTSCKWTGNETRSHQDCNETWDSSVFTQQFVDSKFHEAEWFVDAAEDERWTTTSKGLSKQEIIFLIVLSRIL